LIRFNEDGKIDYVEVEAKEIKSEFPDSLESIVAPNAISIPKNCPASEVYAPKCDVMDQIE